MGVRDIVDRYVAGDLDFEDARDELHALDPAAMRDVLALATASPRGRDLLVMALADVVYPPALPAFRRWLDDPDLEAIAIPAAFALAGEAKQFDVDNLYNLDVDAQRAKLRAIAAWWDAGDHATPTEATWLAELRRKRRRDADEEPPPSPQITADENASLRPQIIELRVALANLPPAIQHRLDVAAIRRVLPIYAAYAPHDRTVEDALVAIEQFLDGGPAPTAWDTPLRDATRAANDAARWSKAHHRWRDPAAKAAGHVAQGVLYALSSDVRNRLQAMHDARDALDLAGRGLAAIRAELAWQLAQVRAAT